MPLSRRDLFRAAAALTPARLASAAKSDTLLAGFRDPPPGFGPVPFWWWTGEPLDRGRLAWQLDQLAAKGVSGVNVNYHHDPKGNTDYGQPPLFSPAWWDLWKWMVGEAKRRGLTIGFDDYTLTWPGRGRIPVELLRANPDMRGLRLGYAAPDQVPAGAQVLARGREGAVFARVEGLDPMHPAIGAKVIDLYFAEFERHTPGEIGRTVNFFFQDELMFGGGMPYWSPRLPEEFRRRKGYDLVPVLAALWEEAGPKTPKIRMDYSDVVVALMEESYFRPIYEWMRQRGVIYGHDQAARGQVVEGSRHYGDYFRTMRWFTAPGNDDPGPGDRRPVTRTKVSSSIAHLYQRPRVWLEGYHSSGWGVTPAQVLGYTNQDYTFGSTILCLHGLYYTTYGGWFEWAPPDFHFRQPYWEHMGAFSGYVSRLSWLLSQGSHRSDVAIVYPVAPVEAGMDGARAEKDAFGLGTYLFERGLDFDFIDHQSLERVVVEGRELRVAGEAYRVLVLPSMRAVRRSTVEKALAFHRAGGLVLLYGCAPEADDAAGRVEMKLPFPLIPDGYERVQLAIEKAIERDFTSSRDGIFVTHRRAGLDDVYFLYNSAGERVEFEARFRAEGKGELWDAWTGQVTPLTCSDAFTRLALEPHEAQVVVFQPGAVAKMPVRPTPVVRTLALDGAWEFSLEPTMDNRYGDFRLPPTRGLLGAEARQFRYSEVESAGWQSPGFDDTAWPLVTYSFGPRLWTLGPLAPGAATAALEARLLALDRPDPAEWKPYSFSLRWGIERDPLQMQTSTGPHGLKEKVLDEFIDLGESAPGSVWYCLLMAEAPAGGAAHLVAGSKSPYTAWVNGAEAIAQKEFDPVRAFGPWNLPDFTPVERNGAVRIRPGVNRVVLKLVQPRGYRVRAYAVLRRGSATVPANGLALQWWATPGSLAYDAAPGRAPRVGCYRFQSPPGLRGMRAVARGSLRVWTDGREAKVAGSGPFDVAVPDPRPEPVAVALRVEQAPGEYAGSAIPEPVALDCGAGAAPCGDWSQIGLATYSGRARYRKTFRLGEADLRGRVWIDTGRVAATAEVLVNGKSAGIRIAPPWRIDITALVHAGENRVEIVVANTLANHYSVGIPSYYVFPGQTASGLLGPVNIEIHA